MEGRHLFILTLLDQLGKHKEFQKNRLTNQPAITSHILSFSLVIIATMATPFLLHTSMPHKMSE